MSLALEGPQNILDIAIGSLARTLKMPRRVLDETIYRSYSADWQNDPFALGAYSYVPVGALDAIPALAAPLKGTLFFAGEATHAGGQSGAVHGAIATGHRVAGELLSRLSRLAA
jgi:monoamine oxidase